MAKCILKLKEVCGLNDEYEAHFKSAMSELTLSV